MITIAPHIKSITNGDGAVVLDTGRNAMVTLNATGALIWQQITRGADIDSIILSLVGLTGADRENVSEDVHAFIHELRSKHLIVGTVSS